MAISGATFLETPIQSRRYQCADAQAITKGDLLGLADANTASGALVGVGDKFAGIAYMDKEASDGSTNITCVTRGICDINLSNMPCSVGDLLMMSGANLVIPASSVALMSGAVVGKALEAGSSWEKIRVAVGDVI